MRLNAEAIKAARDDLKINVSGSLYFPFSFNKRDELHGAVQGYLVKMPAAIVEKLISNQLVLPEGNRANVIAKDKLGVSYRPADEEVAISKHKPFELDPDIIDRGSQAHRKIQNNVAEFLLKHGIQAESPLSSSVNFDVGWQIGSTYFIAEIKSVTEKNFEKQLRLGLGQILRYLYLAKTHQTQLVKPILIVEFVDDISWYNTCSSVGVELIAADNLHKLLSL